MDVVVSIVVLVLGFVLGLSFLLQMSLAFVGFSVVSVCVCVLASRGRIASG